MSKRDYYQVLDVPKTAAEADIKKAYRRLAMKYHPDRNPGDHEAEERFKEAKEAYETLTDAQKRAAYDQFGHAGVDGMRGGGGGGFDPRDAFGDIFGDVFGDIFGGGRRGRSQVYRGADLRYELELDLEQAVFGDTASVEFATLAECEECSGNGAAKGSKPETCDTCRGAGQVRMQQGFFSIQQTCPKCHGSGKVVTSPCGTCSGAGRVKKHKTLSVKIPAGVDEGDRIRLSGEGEAGARGGPAGDLYIFLSVKPHEFFQRDGADLFCRVPISMTTAALGGQFEVSTLAGTKVQIKVPEGTQTGRQFHLKGKGMPVMRSPSMGDLYIQVVTETPQNLTRRQRELLEEFATSSSPQNNPESSGFFSRMKNFLDGLAE